MFLDSNVLLYGIQKTDPRSGLARQLMVSGGTISVQVLNEVASVMRRKHKNSWRYVKETLADLRLLYPDPLPLRAATHDAALELAERHSFNFYDALIVASALEAKCATLLTEDMQDGLVVEARLTIRNPFQQS